MTQAATASLQSYLFHGGRLFDPRRESLVENSEVLVEGGRVVEVSRPDGHLTGPIRAEGAHRIDLGGRTLMPGLIDAHVHIFLTEVNIRLLEDIPPTLLAAQASVLMRDMLMRGFTTVRDTGGGDWGMKVAAETGLLDSPRLFIAGRTLSQTGGHADFRRRTQTDVGCPCCAALQYISHIVDGVPEVLKAVREELRKGADQIKLMVSGGVASPHDPLESLQFRIDEIEAACQEADNWGRYVCAHAYSAEAIQRSVKAGVRTIEHGNLIDEAAAATMAEHRAFLVPTLIAYDAMRRNGSVYGLPAVSQEKNKIVLEAGLRSLELARRAGVQIGFGSDLLGQLQVEQSREFLVRAEAESPLEILRSSTLVNARILRREGKPGTESPDALGELIPGACADLIVVDGDPLLDLGLLQDQGAHIPVIMKGGRFYKNQLPS